MGVSVLCLAGYWGDPNQIPGLLNGFMPPMPYTVVPVQYQNFSTQVKWAAQVDGPPRLDTALHAVPVADNIIVLAHSFGSVLCDAWLNQMAAASDIDPERIQFVLAGDSTGVNGDYTWLYGSPPDSTSYQVIRVVRQYDTHADHPNYSGSQYYQQALDNASAGDSYPHNIHVSYQNLSLASPHLECSVGNTKHVLFPTPLVITSDWGAPVTKPNVESAYHRVGGMTA